MDLLKLEKEAKTAAKKLHDVLVSKKGKKDSVLKLAVAESCTGGLIGAYLTEFKGSSDYFQGGCMAYSNEVKSKTLKVKEKTLKTFGAVSEQTAEEMAQGAAIVFSADIAVSVTGIAGPLGGTKEKPKGTVWIGLYTSDKKIAHHFLFKGDRQQVRLQAVKQALKLVYKAVK